MYDEKSTNINQELNIKPLLFHESVQTTILYYSDSSTRTLKISCGVSWQPFLGD